MVAVSEIIGAARSKTQLPMTELSANPGVLAVGDLLTLSGMVITDKFVAESDKFQLQLFKTNGVP